MVTFIKRSVKKVWAWIPSVSLHPSESWSSGWSDLDEENAPQGDSSSDLDNLPMQEGPYHSVPQNERHH